MIFLGWLSRLLGEMPEETKYKPTTSFKVKDGNSVQVTNQPVKNYQSKDSKQIFVNKYRKKDADKIIKETPNPLEALFSNTHSINSLEDLMKSMNSADKESINKTKEELSGILSKLVMGALIFFVLILGSVTFLTGYDFGYMFSIIFWIFFIIVFSAGKKKVRKSLTDSRK